MQFLDIKTDFAFKKVFGSEESKDVLISFLNAIITFDQHETIVDLSIADPYQIPLIKGMKDSYVDIKALLSNGALPR
jgi:predicted transposase/invertase (TIGR01784 family)